MARFVNREEELARINAKPREEWELNEVVFILMVKVEELDDKLDRVILSMLDK